MKTFVTCLIILLTATTAFAQWEYGGKYIGIGRPQVYPRLAPDGSGGVFVAWQGVTDALDSSYVMLSHFDTSGTALFGEGGINIATIPQDDYGEPQIASDGQGGCFVLWGQVLANAGAPMYMQRIGRDGERLWPENKRLLYRYGYANSYRDGLQLLADTSFGVIAVCKFGAGYTCILGQRIDYDGNLLWDSLGVIIRDTTANWNDDVSCLKTCRSEDRFYCTWQDGRDPETRGDIYLQRFDLGGNVYFGAGGAPVSTSADGDGSWDQRESLQMVPDGIGGVVIGWVRTVLPTYTLIAQRMESDGTPRWQADGIQLLPFSNTNGNALGLHRIGSRFLAVALHSLAKYEIIDSLGYMEYGGQGNRFGQDIYNASEEMNDTLYFFGKIIDQYYYFGSKRDTSGVELWPNLPFVQFSVDRAYDILPDGLGGLFVVLSRYRNWPTDWVILQRIYPDGYVGGDTVGVAGDVPQLPKKALSIEAYPNPFNSSVNISFNMPMAGDAIVRICDNLGRVVDTIRLENLPTGRQKYIWSYQNKDFKLVSGAYFITVQASEYKENCVITLLK